MTFEIKVSTESKYLESQLSLAPTLKADYLTQIESLANDVALETFSKTTFMMIDVGSGGPSARIISFSAEGYPKMGQKIEPEDGELESDFIERIFNIASEKKIVPEVLAVFVDITAWGRLLENHKDYSKEKITDRVNAIRQQTQAHKFGHFQLVSQADEGERAQIALESKLKEDETFRAGLNIAHCEVVDGGRRSNQSRIIKQSREFGEIEIKERLKKEPLEVVQKDCDNAFFNDIPEVDSEQVMAHPFFCGSHLYSLKQKDVVELLGKMGYDSKAWKLGQVTVKAGDLLEAMEKALKKANEKDQPGLVITISILKAYIAKRGAEIARMGEFTNAAGENFKVSHYVGAAIREYKFHKDIAPLVKGIVNL
ncbi:MAG: hypothetical protein H0X29_09930 [Parachlamydiaceae bacterium]|nr:hypothetical protein [Parachlamydiaceae bacterium]